MSQFYFQHEWASTLRRRTRTELEISRFQEQLEIVNAEIKLDVLCLTAVTIFTSHTFLILDRILAPQLSLIYDAVYLILLACAFGQFGIRVLGPSRESLKKLKDSKIRSRWITIGIVVGLIPVLIAGMFVGIHLPTIVLYPAALIIHELIILAFLFLHRRRITQEICGLRRYIQRELTVGSIPASQYRQPIQGKL